MATFVVTGGNQNGAPYTDEPAGSTTVVHVSGQTTFNTHIQAGSREIINIADNDGVAPGTNLWTGSIRVESGGFAQVAYGDSTQPDSIILAGGQAAIGPLVGMSFINNDGGTVGFSDSVSAASTVQTGNGGHTTIHPTGGPSTFLGQLELGSGDITFYNVAATDFSLTGGKLTFFDNGAVTDQFNLKLGNYDGAPAAGSQGFGVNRVGATLVVHNGETFTAGGVLPVHV